MRVGVTIVDEEGGESFGTDAFLRSTGIAPGGNTTFRAILPGIYQLPADPVFSIRAGRVSFTGPAEPCPDPDALPGDDLGGEDPGGRARG